MKKNFKELLSGMTDRAIDALAEELWESYEDNGEDGIGAYLDVSSKEVARMLDVPFDTWIAPAYLADAMKIYKDNGSQEAYLRAELRQIKVREAEIRAKLKALEAEKPKEEVIEVFHVINTEGTEGLKQRLESMEVDELKKVIKENHLDTFHQMTRVTKVDKLRDFIMERTTAFNNKGDVFRNFKY